MPEQSDPIDGQEIFLLNAMLAALHAKAKAGDEAAVDRVLKILDLKRKYKRDKMLEEQY